MNDIIWTPQGLKPKSTDGYPVFDTGLQLGLGVFDTLLVKNGTPQHAFEHFTRLKHDCETVLLTPLPLTFEQFENAIQDVLIANHLEKNPFVRLRTQVTGGIVHSMFERPSNPIIFMTAKEYADPASLPPVHAIIVTDYPRIAGCRLENCKRTDYTRSFLAMQMARGKGANEAILTNTNGHVVCATTSALFIVENGNYITPPLKDGVLDSITRRQMIKEFDAKEESISFARIKEAKKAILTSSLRGKTEIEKLNF